MTKTTPDAMTPPPTAPTRWCPIWRAADPNDPGMLDVVGFDTSTPAVLSDFAAERL